MSDQFAVLEPIDVVQFRDGRPFDAGNDALAVSRPLPNPSGMKGSLIEGFGRSTDSMRGPLIATWSDDGDVELFVATPRDLVITKQRQRRRLTWTKPTVVTDLDEHADHRRHIGGPAGDGDPCGGLIPLSALGEYLAGDHTAALQALAAPASVRPFELASERKLGLALSSPDIDRSGFLYVAQFQRLRGVRSAAMTTSAGYAAWFETDDLIPRTTTVRLGGEARRAIVRTPKPPAIPLPPSAAPDGRLLVYLATPAIFQWGWRLPLPQDVDVVLACLAGPETITGGQHGRWWSANAVSPGSVYLLQFPNEDRALEYAQRVHGKSLNQTTKDLTRAGYGLCFTGVLP